jgi:hypothetical protein
METHLDPQIAAGDIDDPDFSAKFRAWCDELIPGDYSRSRIDVR